MDKNELDVDKVTHVFLCLRLLTNCSNRKVPDRENQSILPRQRSEACALKAETSSFPSLCYLNSKHPSKSAVLFSFDFKVTFMANIPIFSDYLNMEASLLKQTTSF
jgi:hypothetical protein